MFRVKATDGKVLRDILSAAYVIVDEATFQLTSDGLRLRSLDPSRVAMIDLVLPKQAFDEYECTEPTKLCVSLEQLLKLLKRVGKNEAVELALREEKLAVMITGKYVRSFTIPTLQPAEEEPPAINPQFTAKAVVVSDGLRQAIEDAELTGGLATFRANGEKLTLRTTGELSSAEIEFGKGSDMLISLETAQPAEATFSLELLTGMIRAASTVAATATLELATNMPLKAVFQQANGAGLTFFLAPRIEPV